MAGGPEQLRMLAADAFCDADEWAARIVDGGRATGSLGIRDDLVNAGATWVDEPAFRDGNLVWGRVVEDIPAFCRELVAALAEHRASK